MEVKTGTGFTNYPDSNQRHAYNLKPSSGIRVKYTSKECFIQDTFEFLGGLSGDVVWKYTVAVKSPLPSLPKLIVSSPAILYVENVDEAAHQELHTKLERFHSEIGRPAIDLS